MPSRPPPVRMSMFPDELETDRLRLERIDGSFDPLELYPHVAESAPDIDETTEFVTWRPHRHPKETAEFVDHVADAAADDEGATYAVYPREGQPRAGEFAGTAALGVDWDRRLAEFGMWLRTPFWGHGYSGERAAAFMAVAFERLDLEAVAVSHHVDNERSARAIEKYVEAAGGRREGVLRNFHATETGEVFDAVRYTVTAAEWRASQG